MTSAAELAGRIDRLFAALILAGIVLNGGLWLYLSLRLPSLPPAVPIHYNTAGQVDRIAVPRQLLILPAAGLVTLLANSVFGYFGVYSRERQLTYLLLGVGVLVQLLLAGAAFQLVR